MQSKIIVVAGLVGLALITIVAVYLVHQTSPDPGKMVLQAKAYLAEENFADAKILLVQVLAENTEVPGLQNGLCQVYFAEQNYEAAHQHCRLATQQDPADTHARLILARMYMQIGQVAYAITHLETNLKHQSTAAAGDLAWTWYYLGQIAQARNQAEQAATLFQNARLLAAKAADAQLDAALAALKK